jgi:hypothetical protein
MDNTIVETALITRQPCTMWNDFCMINCEVVSVRGMDARMINQRECFLKIHFQVVNEQPNITKKEKLV